MFPESTGPVEATWFSGEIVPDDVTDPTDHSRVELLTLNQRPLEFVWFNLVVYRGKLLLEETVDLKDRVRHTRLTDHLHELFPRMEMAFFHEIHANLADPTPQLVYADWLEERGDPRGEWLRAEVQRVQKEGPRRAWTEKYDRWDIPSGFVPPEDTSWYWRRSAGIPELTPEDRDNRVLLEELRRIGGPN
jgi:uncharacterized protein (TIGR02996 family)